MNCWRKKLGQKSFVFYYLQNLQLIVALELTIINQMGNDNSNRHLKKTKHLKDRNDNIHKHL